MSKSYRFGAWCTANVHQHHVRRVFKQPILDTLAYDFVEDALSLRILTIMDEVTRLYGNRRT